MEAQPPPHLQPDLGYGELKAVYIVSSATRIGKILEIKNQTRIAILLNNKNQQRHRSDGADIKTYLRLRCALLCAHLHTFNTK